MVHINNVPRREGVVAVVGEVLFVEWGGGGLVRRRGKGALSINCVTKGFFA